jgi:hypothetical protein
MSPWQFQPATWRAQELDRWSSNPSASNSSALQITIH